MGLDFVELVLDVEETFGFRIADQDAPTIRTVGDLIRYTRSHVGNRVSPYCATSRAFYQLRRGLLSILPLSRSQVRPDSSLEVLIPARDRRVVWSRLSEAGIQLPPLHLSWPVLWWSMIAVVVLAIALGYTFLEYWLALLLIPPLLVGLAYRATRPLALHADPYDTVAAAVLCLTRVQVEAEVPSNLLSANEIADTLRLMIADHLRVPIDEVTDDARLVEDLGAE